MEYAFIALGGVVFLLLLIIICRTLAFKPKSQIEAFESDTDFDKDRSVECLRSLVKFKTISNRDSSLEDESQFEALIEALPSLYPNVFAKCEFKRMPERGLLFLWHGTEPNNDTGSVVLMSHYDVVDVDTSAWEKPPFDGIIEDGVLWGRGTLDTKATLNATLFSVDTLIARGFTPKSDIYLAFSGNEEINGGGAPAIVDYFEENNIKIGLVLDEGGAVCEDVFPGVKGSCGMIGIAEKGMIDLEYRIKTNGGHASSPKPRSSIGYLSDACQAVEKHPFKMHLSYPVAKMFDTLGRHSTFLYRMIFANWWAFGWVINLLGKKSGGELNALVRTTVAFTQMKGSSAPNVIPPEASLVSNIRLNPLDSVDGATEYIKKTIKNENIELRKLHAVEPSRISRVDCPEYEAVARAVASTWRGAIVSPYLMVQCSDSRNYGRVSDRVYRFSAMDLTSEERRSIHGHNEKIRIGCIHKSCEFYLNLIKQL